MAGARAVGAVGCEWGSSSVGSACRRPRVRVGIRCAPPASRIARVTPLRGVLPSPAALLWCRSPPHVVVECAGVGAQCCPLGLHALWGLRAAGVAGGRPRGGWPATVVRGVWCQALSLPRPLVLWGGQPGFRVLCVPGAVGAGVVTRHRPHSVRSGGPALRAVGVADRGPQGGTFRHCEGRLRSGAPSPPAARPLGGLSGPAIYVLWAWAHGCGGPALGMRALWGMRAAGAVGGHSRGGWPAPVARGVRCQALSLPWPLILWGEQPGSRNPCVLSAVGVGVGTQHRSPFFFCLVLF